MSPGPSGTYGFFEIFGLWAFGVLNHTGVSDPLTHGPRSFWALSLWALDAGGGMFGP